VLGMNLPLMADIAIMVIVILILKRTWWNKLEN
jgi:solute:Na+ symporter, SSS family